jgi:hypothetical protein
MKPAGIKVFSLAAQVSNRHFGHLKASWVEDPASVDRPRPRLDPAKLSSRRDRVHWNDSLR